ncbi:hypothetical protein [Gimesia chilikensis]|uniref:Uncharacterized protein n=1 Tax=Gimesia chilikensis TaxID=2605989 RepID=A0A517W559_9PLAN|nr:hypothetical protein [Gimesia chilikensis]QDT18300.1 hypothetical protein HG66A1_00590 [Gimesia chilikensis]QDU00384.1 hypothetical protein V6x_00570 [Gimesia chilikensis]
MTLSGPWCPGWQDRFRNIIQQMGYDHAFDYVISHQEMSFGKMYGMIHKAAGEEGANSICLRHFIEVYYLDAEREGKLREAFMEALVRSFCQFMRSGWSMGKKVRERRIDVFSRWESPSYISSLDWSYEEWERCKEGVWAEIEQLNPPPEWCPLCCQDTVLQQAFENHWPQT